MRFYRLEDFMTLPNLAFRLAAMQPIRLKGSSERHHRRLSVLTRLIFLLGTVNLLYQNIGMLVFLLRPQRKRSSSGDSLDFVLQLSETGSILGLIVVAACKMLLLFWHSERISQLTETFRCVFPGAQIQRAQYWTDESYKTIGFYAVQRYAEKSHRLMKTTAIFFMTAFCWYNLFPLLEAIFTKLTSPDKYHFNYRYQSNTWYPWQAESNADSIVLYVVAYLCQLHSSLRLHFDFLSDALENLDARGTQALEKLKFLIDYHSKLLRFSAEINEIFNISFLINFITSSIAICLMCCSIVLATNPINCFKYSVGLLSFLVFTLFICYNGSEFTCSSDKLMWAAFHNNWYAGNRSYRRMILFFIMSSLRPSVLRAYKFADVSMQTYMAILKFSYQLFTFLRAVA